VLAAFAFHFRHAPGTGGAAVQTVTDVAAQLFQFERLQLVVRFHDAQRLSDDFAGRVVASGGHLAANQFLQLRSEVDVERHSVLPVNSKCQNSAIGKDCQGLTVKSHVFENCETWGYPAEGAPIQAPPLKPKAGLSGPPTFFPQTELGSSGKTQGGPTRRM